MKCKDFEFEYIAAPNEIAGDACEHLQGCTVCQSFIERQVAFEEQLKSVIKIGVPEGFRHSVREHVTSKRGVEWKVPLAGVGLAASIMLGVGLVNFTPAVQKPIDRLIVEHLDYDEIGSLKATHAIDTVTLASVEKQFGVRVNLPGKVRLAEKCPIGDSYGLHIVYQGKDELITFIYMPEIEIKKALSFNYSGHKGWVEPVQKGSLAIVSGSTLNANYDISAIKDSIEWL
jgi:hypothetical protein